MLSTLDSKKLHNVIKNLPDILDRYPDTTLKKSFGKDMAWMLERLLEYEVMQADVQNACKPIEDMLHNGDNGHPDIYHLLKYKPT